MIACSSPRSGAVADATSVKFPVCMPWRLAISLWQTSHRFAPKMLRVFKMR